MPSSKDQQKLTELICDIRKRDDKKLREKFKYAPKDEKPIDWSSYNQAQIMEINNMLVLIKNMCEEAYDRISHKTEQKGKVGAPFKKRHEDKAKAIMVQQLFGVSDRVAEGIVFLFKEKLGITQRITAKNIERSYENRNVKMITDEVFEMSNEVVSDKETDFSVDGTGESTTIKNNWENDKNDSKKVQRFERVIGIVGVHTGMFSDVIIADEPHDNESPYLKDLVMNTSLRYNNVNYVFADAMYLSRDNCDIIESVGAIPRILPKSNTRLNTKGSAAWKRMLQGLVDTPQKWLREYHNRSLSESINSSWKRRFMKPLTRIIGHRRKFSCLVRACVHNIRRLGYLHYLWGLHIPWLRD